MSETDPRPTNAAVAAASRCLAECQVAETTLAAALADVESVVMSRSEMGFGVVGARKLPASGGPSLPQSPVAALLAATFQKCGPRVINDLFQLLSAVRQAGHLAAVRLHRDEAMAAYDRFDPPVKADPLDSAPADDPLSPADSEGGDL